MQIYPCELLGNTTLLIKKRQNPVNNARIVAIVSDEIG